MPCTSMISKDTKAAVLVAIITGMVTTLFGLVPYYIETHSKKKANPNTYHGPLIIDSTRKLDLGNPLCLIVQKAIDDYPNKFGNLKGEHRQGTVSSGMFNIKDLPEGFDGYIEGPIGNMYNGESAFRLEVYSMENQDSALKRTIECHNAFVQCQDGFVPHMNANSIKGQKIYYSESFVKSEIIFELKCWGPFSEQPLSIAGGRYFVYLSCKNKPD